VGPGPHRWAGAKSWTCGDPSAEPGDCGEFGESGEPGESGESGEPAETGDGGESADCAGAGACLVVEDFEVLDCCGAGAGEAAETAESGETAETVGPEPAEAICSTAGSWCGAFPEPSSSASASRRDPASAPAPCSGPSPGCTARCSPPTIPGAC